MCADDRITRARRIDSFFSREAIDQRPVSTNKLKIPRDRHYTILTSEEHGKKVIYVYTAGSEPVIEL